mgnify:CR=1 FL=1
MADTKKRMTVREFLAIPQGERPTMMDAEGLWNRIGELEAALRDATKIAASYERNKMYLLDALRAAKLPESWLISWDAKFKRICATAERKAQ